MRIPWYIYSIERAGNSLGGKRGLSIPVVHTKNDSSVGGGMRYGEGEAGVQYTLRRVLRCVRDRTGPKLEGGDDGLLNNCTSGRALVELLVVAAI